MSDQAYIDFLVDEADVSMHPSFASFLHARIRPFTHSPVPTFPLPASHPLSPASLDLLTLLPSRMVDVHLLTQVEVTIQCGFEALCQVPSDEEAGVRWVDAASTSDAKCQYIGQGALCKEELASHRLGDWQLLRAAQGGKTVGGGRGVRIG